jgi:hypothetical protein
MNPRRTAGAALAAFVTMAAVAVAGAGASGCATAPAERQQAAASMADPPRRSGKPVVLIAMPKTKDAEEVRHSMVAELKKNFDVVTFVVEEGASAANLARALQAAKPACIVLMNNSTIKLYRELRKAQPAAGENPPVVMVLASLVEDMKSYIPNSTGIAYEVTALTAVANLRSVISKKVTRVAVVHRPPFQAFVARQKVLAAREKIEIVPLEVGRDPSADDISGALKKAGAEAKADALWVLNDNGLLKDGAFIASVWQPALQALGLPVIVGVPALVDAQVHFGTFAVLPDHEALGVQTANLIFDLQDQDWNATDQQIELPLSTKTVCDIKQVKERFGLREGAASAIDRVVE